MQETQTIQITTSFDTIKHQWTLLLLTTMNVVKKHLMISLQNVYGTISLDAQHRFHEFNKQGDEFMNIVFEKELNYNIAGWFLSVVALFEDRNGHEYNLDDFKNVIASKINNIINALITIKEMEPTDRQKIDDHATDAYDEFMTVLSNTEHILKDLDICPCDQDAIGKAFNEGLLPELKNAQTECALKALVIMKQFIDSSELP